MPSKLHEKAIEQELGELKKQGYKCIPIRKPLPDIIAVRNGKVVAVEIAVTQDSLAATQKYEKQNFFDEVKVFKIDEKIDTLPRELKIMDERGRLTVPEYMRSTLEIKVPCAVWVELYPPDNPKALVIKKG